MLTGFHFKKQVKFIDSELLELVKTEKTEF